MDLKDIKGIGKAKLAQLNDAGIFSPADVLNTLPKRYYDFGSATCFSEDNFSKIIKATLIDEPKVVRIKGLSYTTAKFRDDNNLVFNAVWYNQTYIKSVLIPSETYYLYGKNSPKKAKTFVVSLSRHSSKIENNVLATYKKIGSFGSVSFSNLVLEILNNFEQNSIIPENIEKKYQLIDLNRAYRKVHFPNSIEEYQIGKTRLDIEKLVPLAIKNLNQKIYFAGNRGHLYHNLDEIYDNFCSMLPFKLTDDQNKVISDIVGDLSSSKAMNRLLQGEVGSGKTMVAFFALFAAAINGYQGALIAPTEILATQHYEKLLEVFKKTNINIVYLNGSLTAAQKRSLLNKISCGEAQIVVGTHAVIGAAVNFEKLALAVVDEQHRFGVAQRAKLSAKGKNVDVLVMSATPIPRSMALAIYGDLSLSVISKCPFIKDISTSIVSRSKQLDMWKWVKEKADSGSKIFVVCSSIEEDEEIEVDYSANSMHKNIVNLFGKDAVLLIHGKQSKEIQQKTMNQFASGSAQVLVATTIVEVGVDIPEADIIILASPERFGLATLHQLRGRVGRNGTKSYCFCLAHEDLSVKSIERLKYFCSHSSGFDIAEYDYQNRGAGDIYGTNQHGQKADFGINLKNYDLAMQIAQDQEIDDESRNKLLMAAEASYSKLCNDIVLN